MRRESAAFNKELIMVKSDYSSDLFLKSTIIFMNSTLSSYLRSLNSAEKRAKFLATDLKFPVS